MITRSDLRQLSYAEFGGLLDQLTAKIVDSGVTFDLIVPILRSGGFTGLHIASKLKVQNILPAQYKYVYQPNIEVVKKFDFPKLHFDLPATPSILIVDSNTVEGKIAGKVVADIQAAFSGAIVYFASAALDAACQLTGVEAIFYGVQTNEARTLSPDQAAQRGVSDDILIFPWENLDEQWQEIQVLQAKE